MTNNPKLPDPQQQLADLQAWVNQQREAPADETASHDNAHNAHQQNLDLIAAQAVADRFARGKLGLWEFCDLFHKIKTGGDLLPPIDDIKRILARFKKQLDEMPQEAIDELIAFEESPEGKALNEHNKQIDTAYHESPESAKRKHNKQCQSACYGHSISPESPEESA